MNTKIRKAITRTISLLIIMVMITGAFPFSVLADELSGGGSQTTAALAEPESAPESDPAPVSLSDNDTGDDAVSSDNEDTVAGSPDADNAYIPSVNSDGDGKKIPGEADAEAASDEGNGKAAADVVNGTEDPNGAENPNGAEKPNGAEDSATDDAGNPDAVPAPTERKSAPVSPDYAGTLNRLTISRSETDFPSGSSYVMDEAEGQEFLVNYRYADLENVVLVVECLGIGADFAAIPEKNEFFNEAVLLGQGKMALKLTSSQNRTDCTIGFRMKHVKLTDEQVLEIMDGSELPSTRIAATEYTIPEGASLSDVLTSGTKGEECILWEGTPYFNPDTTITVTSSSAGYTHSYKVTVSPVSTENGGYTNFFFDRFNTNNKEGMLDGYKNASPRFSIPCAYNRSGALMEILSIRFYEPTELVRLKGISRAGAGSGSNTGDLFVHNYNADWSNWTVGERTYDPEKDAYYYELTPPARCFNANTFGMTEYLTGMTLRWTLNNTADALDPDTSYLAENTVITFRLPGDGQTSRTAEVRGPEILTGSVGKVDMSTTYSNYRLAHSGTYMDVNVGQKYVKDEFTRYSNAVECTANLTKFPIYDRAVTQEYDFPYQIAPSKIYIESIRSKIMAPEEHPVLDGISYNTWDDDTWIDVDQSKIDEFNTILGANGSGNFSYDLLSGSQIKTIQVKWQKTSIWNYPGNSSPIYTFFDFTPNHCTDNTCSDHLAQGVQVMVRYREYYDTSYRNGEYGPDIVVEPMMLPGQTAPRNQKVERALWFRLKCEACEPKKCPELLCNPKDDTTAFFNSGINGNIGDVGFDIGKRGMTYDCIHNPVITLSITDSSSTSSFAKIQNINDSQMIAFFTGEFTAMPKLSGWVFEYTAENKDHDIYTNSVTIPEITDKNGVKDCWLPLPEGYAFTSVKLSYDGELNLRPEDENDNSTRIWLMTGIVVHRNDDIPFLSEKVYVADNRDGAFHLAGSVTFDITELADENGPHCACGQHINGKGMTYLNPDGLYHIKSVRVRSNRSTTFYMEFSQPKNAVIYQGEGIGDSPSESESVTWDNGVRSFFANSNSLFYQFPTCHVEMHPYEDISEAVYIELTDEEFMPDLENSMLWGYSLSDNCIQTDIISVYDSANKPHRFLKIKFVDGFVRTKTYSQISAGKYEWTDKGIREVDKSKIYYPDGNNVWSIDGHIYRDGNVTTGPFTLAFKTVPGTTIGEHHPIGKIYYDLSDIVENYNASFTIPREEWNGYDNNYTFYRFGSEKNLTTDSLGITGNKTTQLFYQDGSNWTVNVLLHQETGVSLVPGKNKTYYDYDNHEIGFLTGEENDLNALVTLTGPGEPTASSIYDVTSITVLPRTGKAIAFTQSEVSGGSQTDTEKYSEESTMDLYLRGAPYVVGNSADSDPLFTYTTSEDPLSEDAVWLSSDDISDWRSVTGIKVIMSSMAPKTSVNIRLDLETDAKTTLDIQAAFAGGRFTYRLTKNGDFIDPQNLELSTWFYDNYEINGFVFWDFFDENGLFTRGCEGGIEDVILTLYDASGNVISQKGSPSDNNTRSGEDLEEASVRTNFRGEFKLYSNTNEEGQYIVISFPEKIDDQEPCLTAVSKNPYMMSSDDSDFDRTTNTLVLGQLDKRKGYNNVSAGYIIMPKVNVFDIEMYVGDTLKPYTLIDEYVINTIYDSNNILTNGTYKIAFNGIDESIATFKNDGKLRSDDFNVLRIDSTVTGISAGQYTAEAVVTNGIGDTVSAQFRVTVYERPQEDIIVTNSWDDDDNRDGIRPEGITVQLMKNGVAEGDPVVLSDENGNTYTWSNLLRYDENDNEIVYTLSVDPVADVPGHTGYTQEVNKSGFLEALTETSGGYKFTINNVHIPETVERSLVVIWDDEDNVDGIRPDELAIGTSYGSTSVLNANVAWEVSVSGLYKYENGNLIDYGWVVPDVPEGYTFSQEVDGTRTTLTYVHRPAKTEPQPLLGEQGGDPVTQGSTPLPSTGESTSPAVYIAVSCIILAGAILLITVRRFGKKENR